MKKVVIAMAVVVLLALCLSAGEEEGEAHHGDHHELEVLERNIRLMFEFIDGDEEGHEVASVVTAVPEYRLATSDENEEYDVSIGGLVFPQPEGRILTMMEVKIVLVDEGKEMAFVVECGVLLSPGEGSEVARWGERAFVVHAEYD
jgi:hypothetical protein